LYYGQHFRILTNVYLANAALGLASTTENRKPILRIARQKAKKLRGEKSPLAEPFIPYINGCVARLEGDEDSAVKLLREAANAFDGVQYKLYAAATRRQLGRLLGGDEGRALVEQADDIMKKEGIVRPDRVAAMLAPGFPD